MQADKKDKNRVAEEDFFPEEGTTESSNFKDKEKNGEDGPNAQQEVLDPAALTEELEKVRAEAKENFDRFLRMQADFDNFRKRTRQEKEDLYRYGSERVVCSLLPVLDNFERAIASAGDDANALREGVQMIFRQLNDALAKEGITCMDCVGKEFDPNYHEAVMQVESTDHPDNTVVEEFQKGYLLHEKVLRPAMVKVAKGG